MHFVLGAHVDHLVSNEEVKLFDQLFRLLLDLGARVVKHLERKWQHHLIHLTNAALVSHIVYIDKVSRQKQVYTAIEEQEVTKFHQN